MIDPKELRWGSIVAAQGGGIPREGITWSDYAILEPYGVFMAQTNKCTYDPIPITPKWLERLGFVRTRDLIHTAEFVLLGGPCIHILFSKIDGRLYLGESFITRSGDDEDEFIAVPLTFIHQVQNLHFALTGQELTIKEVDNGI